MAMEGTQYRLPGDASADEGFVWKGRHQPFGGRGGQTPHMKHDEGRPEAPKLFLLGRRFLTGTLGEESYCFVNSTLPLVA
jgi:hypothetical protein